MLIACWSCKGGSGTSVVAASLALLSRRASASDVLAVDLPGDLPAVLGVPDPTGPGLAQWLATPDVADDALARLEVEVAPGLRLLAAGIGTAPAVLDDTGTQPDRAEMLVAALADDPRPVVADCGVLGPGANPAALALAGGAGLSLLVLRPCYLALRKAVAAPLRPSGVVLLVEPGRALGRLDVEDVLGVPVRAEVEVDAGVARAVDAGLLAGRLPRELERALRTAA